MESIVKWETLYSVHMVVFVVILLLYFLYIIIKVFVWFDLQYHEKYFDEPNNNLCEHYFLRW